MDLSTAATSWERRDVVANDAFGMASRAPRLVHADATARLRLCDLTAGEELLSGKRCTRAGRGTGLDAGRLDGGGQRRR